MQKGVVDARQPSSCRAIANCQKNLIYFSGVTRLVIGRQSTGVKSSNVQTVRADPYTQRALGIVENLCLDLPVCWALMAPGSKLIWTLAF